MILGIGLNPYFRGEVYGEVRFVVPFTYLQFIFPAVIALNILYTSVQSAVSVIWDREFGFLREVLVSPLVALPRAARQGAGRRHRGAFPRRLVLVLARFVDVALTPRDSSGAFGLMFADGLRADLARGGHRRADPELRGLRRLRQRRHPAALLHLVARSSRSIRR